MKIIRLLLFVIATVTVLSAQAHKVEMKISQCSTPLAVNINNVSRNLSQNDTLILNFDKKGKYYIDRTVRVKCNFEMKGLGKDKIKIILTEGLDNNGKRMFVNDCYFFLDYPKNGNRGEVSIHDVSVEMERHKNIWWPNREMHLFKICNANKVTIQNTKTSVHNAFITNFDLRSCSNVTVESNEIINYNNCVGGGCLWMRDNQRNVEVKNNVFRKYGTDEVIAIWGTERNGSYVIENVEVSGNTIYYGNYNNSSMEWIPGMLISLYHCRDKWVDKSRFMISNVSINNNDITLDFPVKFVMMVKFDDLATTSGISLTNNKIYKSSRCVESMTSAITDFKIEDRSSNNSTITISGNESRSKYIDLDKHGMNSSIFISAEQGKIIVNDNNLDYENGLRFYYITDKGSEISMKGNYAKGLYKLATVSSDKGIVEEVKINAYDNVFIGDTRLYFKNVKKGDLNFTNNTFIANDYHIFMQESPDEVSIVFNNNTIKSSVGDGKLCANYSGKKIDFRKLEIKDNTFTGLSRASSLLGDFSKSPRKVISGNLYYK